MRLTQEISFLVLKEISLSASSDDDGLHNEGLGANETVYSHHAMAEIGEAVENFGA